MKTPISISVIFAVLWVAGGIGWILNIVHIIHEASNPITALFIVKCVGIFIAPLGAVLGYAA